MNPHRKEPMAWSAQDAERGWRNSTAGERDAPGHDDAGAGDTVAVLWTQLGDDDHNKLFLADVKHRRPDGTVDIIYAGGDDDEIKVKANRIKSVVRRAAAEGTAVSPGDAAHLRARPKRTQPAPAAQPQARMSRRTHPQPCLMTDGMSAAEKGIAWHRYVKDTEAWFDLGLGPSSAAQAALRKVWLAPYGHWRALTMKCDGVDAIPGVATLAVDAGLSGDDVAALLALNAAEQKSYHIYIDFVYRRGFVFFNMGDAPPIVLGMGDDSLLRGAQRYFDNQMPFVLQSLRTPMRWMSKPTATTISKSAAHAAQHASEASAAEDDHLMASRIKVVDWLRLQHRLKAKKKRSALNIDVSQKRCDAVDAKPAVVKCHMQLFNDEGNLDILPLCEQEKLVDECDRFHRVATLPSAQRLFDKKTERAKRVLANRADYVVDGGDTLKTPFKTSTGARPILTMSGVQEWYTKAEKKLRFNKLVTIERECAVSDNHSQRLYPIQTIMTMLLFFGGASARVMEQCGLIFLSGGYLFATQLSMTIAVVYMDLLMRELAGKNLVGDDNENRVMLMLADNFVKLSKISFKRAGESIMHSAPTVMFAFMWLRKTGGEVSKLNVPRGEGAKPLNTPYDEAADKMMRNHLEGDDVKNLAAGWRASPYVNTFTERDTQGKRDVGTDPSTTDYWPFNTAGQFGRHATFFTQVLSWVVTAVAAGGVTPFAIFLADQEGAWIWEKLSAGLITTAPIAISALVIQQTLAFWMVAYAAFHARKNLSETLVYDSINLRQFWAPFLGGVYSESKYVGDAPMDADEMLRKFSTKAGLITFMQTQRPDLITKEVKAMKKEALVAWAFALGARSLSRDKDNYAPELSPVDPAHDAPAALDDGDDALGVDALQGGAAMIGGDVRAQVAEAGGEAAAEAASRQHSDTEEHLAQLVAEYSVLDSAANPAASSAAVCALTNVLTELDLFSVGGEEPGARSEVCAAAFALVEKLSPPDDDDGVDGGAEGGGEDATGGAGAGGDGARESFAQTTKVRKSKSIGYTRVELYTSLLWNAWFLFFRYVCLYELSQQKGFAEAFPSVGDDGSATGWSADFIARMARLRSDDGEEAFDASFVAPTVPFAIEEAVKWGMARHKGFAFHWKHLDTEVRLMVEPFDELVANGNVLPLWNSLLSRACLLIDAERAKLARVDLCYLRHLLYWQFAFPLLVLPFFALHCKRIYQDVIIEYTNRLVSVMCRRDNVEPSLVTRMTCCLRQKRRLQGMFSCVTGAGRSEAQPPTLTKLRKMHWSERFRATRVAQSQYLSKLCRDMFDNAKYGAFAAPDRIQDVLNDRLIHSKRGDVYGITRHLADLLAALSPSGRPAAGVADSVASLTKKELVAELKRIKAVLTGEEVREAERWKPKWKLQQSVRHAQLVVHLKAARIVLAAHKRRVAPSRAGRRRTPSKKQAAVDAQGSGSSSGNKR